MREKLALPLWPPSARKMVEHWTRDGGEGGGLLFWAEPPELTQLVPCPLLFPTLEGSSLPGSLSPGLSRFPRAGGLSRPCGSPLGMYLDQQGTHLCVSVPCSICVLGRG